MQDVQNLKKSSQILKRDIFPILPSSLRQILDKVPKSYIEQLEEIRLRKARPLMLECGIGNFMVTKDGKITNRFDDVYVVSEDDVSKTIQLISQGSLYAIENELRNGYITIKGGHRVGITGTTVLDENGVKTIKSISSLNIRIAREIMGAANKILPYLIDTQGDIYSTLIISPPKAGKTTILRDLIRQLSSGISKFNVDGFKIGLIDERSEIACCYNGIPQNDVGIRTDVLDGCPKAFGMIMLLRAMSPEIIVTDEIGRAEDVLAIEEAVNAGVKIIATAHGKDLEDIKKRPTLKEILTKGFFKRYIILGFSSGIGTLEKVVDGDNNIILFDKDKIGGMVFNAT